METNEIAMKMKTTKTMRMTKMTTTKMMMLIVPSWIRTRVVGFKVQSDDHYTNGT